MAQGPASVPTRTIQPILPHPPANGKDPSVSDHLRQLNRYFQQQQVAIDALYGKLATRLNELSFIYVGSGSPEGVIPAPIGSLYSRLDGGAGTSLYVKESGTGNVGWVGK